MKIATLNLQHFDGPFKRQLAWMEEEQADIYCLQEGFVPLIPFPDRIRVFAEAIGYSCDSRIMHRVEALDVTWTGWSIGVLSRQKMIGALEYELGVYDRDQWRRSVCMARLEDGTRVMSVHLSCTEGHEEQLRKILWCFDHFYPTGKLDIIAGDFNQDAEASPYLDILRQAGFKDAWVEAGGGEGPTMFDPDRRIDQIWFRGDWQPRNAKTINGLSDHQGVVVW